MAHNYANDKVVFVLPWQSWCLWLDKTTDLFQYHLQANKKCPLILTWWHHQMETFSALLAITGIDSNITHSPTGQ